MQKIITLTLVLSLLSGAALANMFEEKIKASIQTKYIEDSDAENQIGEIGIVDTKFSAKQVVKIGRLPLEWNVGYRYIDIDENLALTLPSELQSYSIGFGAKMPLMFLDWDDWFMGVDLSMTMNTDDGSYEDSAARFPTRTYLIYRPVETLFIFAGAGFTPDATDEVYPIIGFRYEPNEQWTFNFASANPSIEYDVNDKLTVMIEGAVNSDEFEVTRGADKNVVLSYDAYSAGLGFKYGLTENFEVKLSAGSEFGRKLDYEDEQGKVVLDDAFYTSVKISAEF